MSVGDIESKEKGSGARYNDGKPDYSLILISDFVGHLKNVSYDDEIISILACLGRFQKTHDVYDLYAALSGCTHGDVEEIMWEEADSWPDYYAEEIEEE